MKNYNKIYQKGEIIRREKQEKGSKDKTDRIENIED